MHVLWLYWSIRDQVFGSVKLIWETAFDLARCYYFCFLLRFDPKAYVYILWTNKKLHFFFFFLYVPISHSSHSLTRCSSRCFSLTLTLHYKTVVSILTPPFFAFANKNKEHCKEMTTGKCYRKRFISPMEMLRNFDINMMNQCKFHYREMEER